MAPSLTSRPGRGLNLPNSKDVSAQNADEEKGDDVVKDTFNLLERGEKEIILDDKHRDVILILGNTGSGKSTFTQWIAGDNSKMISKETEEGTGEYIIEDHNRIGNTTLKSKTVFPELVVDAKTNAAYYDCPGFSDTQGTSHDIAITYFIKRVVDFSESVKMVFTISHPSVRKGVDRQDFMKLLKHTTDLVKDIEKFKHSIALVATKVDNQYIKKGKDFVLVEDNKVIAAIVNFLQEAKQYLEDNSRRSNISEKENRFYEKAIAFVEVLLEKEGENYPRIGIFRRPDMPGPVSDIPLLQQGKQHIAKIVYERLNFTAKNNEDFGYTVSEKTKNDINEIIEEINKNLWSSLSDVTGKIQENYRKLVEQVHRKIRLLVSEPDAIDVNISDAEVFGHRFNMGCSIITDLVIKTKNLTDPEELAVIINNTISSLDIDIPKYDIVNIGNQGKYFNFLQTVSDKILISKPWYEMFQDVKTFLSGSKTVIIHDATLAAEKINIRIQNNLNDTVKAIHEEYTGKIKSLEIQKLPEKLNRDSQIIFELTEELKNGTTTTENLVNAIFRLVNNLDISVPKENLQNIANKGKYLRFLSVISEKTLAEDTTTWLSPFRNIAKYFYESEKWYIFLEDMYNKFSEYDIQRDRQLYNVADLEDWGQTGKPQGIAVTPNTFEKFLNKIKDFNVTEYENIKSLTATDLQIEELNQMLSLTLKHRPTVMCSEPYVIVKGSFISLNETSNNVISNTDTNNSCGNFKAQLEEGKYNLFKFLALNKVFVDTDLSFSGKRMSIAVISPKWEVVGSRSIDLNGANGSPHSVSKAKNGPHPGNDGYNGSPGNPGVSGESFFGIGSTFVGGANLKISSDGGRGGRGQDGGDGATGVPGLDAQTPSDSDPICNGGYFRDFKCENVGERHFETNDGDYLTFVNFKMFGLLGGKGGNGGDGGKGGKGGDPGNITVLELSQSSATTKLSSKGIDGEIGKSGVGGPGAKNGDGIIAEWGEYTLTGWHCLFVKCPVQTWWKWKQTIKNDGRGPDGSNGHAGTNDVGMQDPVTANGIHTLPNIINEYKIYLRENINDRFKKQPLLQFLDQINSRDDVRKLYDTRGLIDEFLGLEEQIHKLSDKMDLSPFYSSLLERISDFAKSLKDDPTSSENKKVLNYMYTAILGRMHNLKEDSEQILIIDISGYLNIVKENIKTLKNQQMTSNKVDIINKYRENYKKGIDKKIEEAKSFIKEHITHEIENINTGIDDRINSLIEETIALQKQAEKERQKLSDKKKELGNSLAVKGLFSFFQIVGGVVSFLGPIGEIAGTVIKTAGTVAESLTLNSQQEILNLPSDVVSAIKSVGNQIKAIRNQKVAYLNKLLNDLSEEIQENPEKLSDMEIKIADIKDKLKKASENKLDFKQVKTLENELKQELKRKGEDLKIHSSDEKSVDALKVIGKITQIAEFGSLLLNLWGKMKEDEDKMDAITDAMEKIEDKIKKLREYEENIYDTIVPMLNEMEDHMMDITGKLGSKSQVALDVTQWQVQSTLKDMRLQMERLTEEFEVKNDISRSIEKLEEVMTTLINVYGRIQNYQEQQNLANYIADISSVAANSINITDKQLRGAVNHLEFAITANIVLKQYKSAIDAFKQWVFPLADDYMEKSMLPKQLELAENVQNLVQGAVRNIETIKQKLDLYNVAIKDGDQYLECEEFSSRYVSSEPFFVWKNEKYGSSISNLLSGKEVVLKADIEDSAPHKDAIKFSEIDFHFSIKNKTAKSLLFETLKGFDIRATHLGNSYYRYTNKIFLITSDSVTVSYSYEKNDDGIPIRSNNAYNQLRSGDLLLSPYTSWEVRFVNKTNKYSFQDLESFKSEIDVELSGFGSYIDTNDYRPTAIVYNNTILHLLRSKATGLNQCRRTKYRVVRSPEEIEVEDRMTNGASVGVPSPVNFLCNFLKTYFVSNVLIPLNQIFSKEQISVRNCEVCSEVPYEIAEKSNIGSIVASNPTIADTDTSSADDCNYEERIALKSISVRKQKSERNYEVCSEMPDELTETRNIGPNVDSNPTTADTDTSSEDDCNYQKRIALKSDSICFINFDGNNNCSKPPLLSDRNDKSTNHSLQVSDINCSLLLADLLTRTVTGNRYKLPIDECLLSPPEVVLRKISTGVVRSESDVKQMLQCHLSENEVGPSSWFSKLNSYAKSMFRFLGLAGNDDTEEYVKDVRHLFV